MIKPRNEITTKVQFIENRIRCSKCGCNDAIYIISDDIRFRASVLRPSHKCPIFKIGLKMRKIVINKNQELETRDSLIRVCVQCGASRKTGLS